MSASSEAGSAWPAVLERFERHAPAGVTARSALERALPAGWVDKVFETHRERQYSREPLFSAVVELATLVSLGLRPSLHAAARQIDGLPVPLASLYDKVRHTEPGALRALVRGSAERLAPVLGSRAGRGGLQRASLSGWRLRVLDGSRLAASEKRLGCLRGLRGAALPGQPLVVYDPDTGLAVDLAACEEAHASERAATAPLLEGARPGELWIAGRHFSTAAIPAWPGKAAGTAAAAQGNRPSARAGGQDQGPDRSGGGLAACRTRAGPAHRGRRHRHPAVERSAGRGSTPDSTAPAGGSKACSDAWNAC